MSQPTLHREAFPISPSSHQIVESQPAEAVREQQLRQLLDGPYGPDNFGNFDFAKKSGLIDEFFYDAASGYDGIVHTLAGNLTEFTGALQVGGFHHEPSGRYTSASNQAASVVDRTHLPNLNSKERAEFKELPFEPYKAKVDIDGLRKVTQQTDTDGELEFVETKNSMFPKEYDALAVLQVVRIAKQGRDRDQDKITDNGLIVATGMSIMVDNTSPMRIRLIMEAGTEKIISAMPLVKPSGIMKLGQASIDHFVYGDGASVEVAK